MIELIDTFLSPLCNYNILVVTGPIGCGKTTKIKEELSLRQDSICADYLYNIKNLKVGVMTLDDRKIVRVIDPADSLDIPIELLKQPAKYIFITDSLKNLPDWCSSEKVMQLEIPLPTREELLIALKIFEEDYDPQTSSSYDFSIQDIPDNIKNYNQLKAWVCNPHTTLQSSDSPFISRNFDDIIDGIRDGEIKDDIDLSAERVLNRIVTHPEGIEYISLLDMFYKSGFPREIISRILKKVVKEAPKLVPYKGVFSIRKKKEKVEEEFETGDVEDEISPAKELKIEKDKTSLFDF